MGCATAQRWQEESWTRIRTPRDIPWDDASRLKERPDPLQPHSPVRVFEQDGSLAFPFWYRDVLDRTRSRVDLGVYFLDSKYTFPGFFMGGDEAARDAE